MSLSGQNAKRILWKRDECGMKAVSAPLRKQEYVLDTKPTVPSTNNKTGSLMQHAEGKNRGKIIIFLQGVLYSKLIFKQFMECLPETNQKITVASCLDAVSHSHSTHLLNSLLFTPQWMEKNYSEESMQMWCVKNGRTPGMTHRTTFLSLR